MQLPISHNNAVFYARVIALMSFHTVLVKESLRVLEEYSLKDSLRVLE